MFTRPDDLSDQAVADAVAAGWELRADEIEYLPVGFGSYHWRLEADGSRWFVTADDLLAKRRNRDEPNGESLRRLRAALSTARLLRDEGLTFVVAPIAATSGDVLHEVDDRFAVAVYPYVAGEPGAWESYATHADRRAVLDLIVDLHRVAGAACRNALVDDFAIPSRDDLATAVVQLSDRWDTGPFGEPARTLLARHADAVASALAYYDVLVAAARLQSERFVLTHGEPHPGNTLVTDGGVMLIDWETLLLAPPERDVWTLADGDREIIDVYERATGVALLDDTLELYRLWWDLAEIAISVALFRRPHRETADTSLAWAGLERYLDPDRRRA